MVMVFNSVSDVSDTILYLLLGTTEPAEIENAEVYFTLMVHEKGVTRK